MDASKGLIVLKPVLHNNIWGGRRLEQFGYELPDGPVGECWGISAHPHGDCTVDGGPFNGMTLSQLWDEHHELFEGAKGDRFPLLIKVLDALDDLSIQVHPDDAYAMEHENGSLGKHECWYVLDCHEHAHIIVGQHAKSREEFAKLVEENRWHDMENFVPIKKGDFFDIKPGTVHAILGSTLILETQQSSDVTYRVFDYNRRQPDGSLRELHLQPSLAGLGVVSKDVKNKGRAIDDLARFLDRLFKIGLLGRRELVIKDDHVSLERIHQAHQLLRLSRANERSRHRRVKTLRHRTNDHSAVRLTPDELEELVGSRGWVDVCK